ETGSRHSTRSPITSARPRPLRRTSRPSVKHWPANSGVSGETVGARSPGPDHDRDHPQARAVNVYEFSERARRRAVYGLSHEIVADPLGIVGALCLSMRGGGEQSLTLGCLAKRGHQLPVAGDLFQLGLGSGRAGIRISELVGFLREVWVV